MEGKKGYMIGEGIVVVATLFFIMKLHKYNQVLHEIQKNYDNNIQKTIQIASEPNYFNYLLGGAFFIAVLVGYTLFIFKSGSSLEGIGWVLSLINICLLIILLVVFWNPVLATFAALLLGGGLFALANS